MSCYHTPTFTRTTSSIQSGVDNLICAQCDLSIGEVSDSGWELSRLHWTTRPRLLGVKVSQAKDWQRISVAGFSCRRLVEILKQELRSMKGPVCLIYPICLPSPHVQPALTQCQCPHLLGPLPSTACSLMKVSSGVKISGQDGTRCCPQGGKWVYFKDWSDQCVSGHAGMTYWLRGWEWTRVRR